MLSVTDKLQQSLRQMAGRPQRAYQRLRETVLRAGANGLAARLSRRPGEVKSAVRGAHLPVNATFELLGLAGTASRGSARWLRRNLSVLLVLVPVLLYLPAILWLQLPSQFAVVMSGSMEPEYRAGDVVILRPVGEIEVGQVMAFDTPLGVPGYPPRLLHRVVDYDPQDARMTTQGDANPEADPFPVGVESLLGEATGLKIPYGGYAILFFQSSYGRVWLATVALICALPIIGRVTAWGRRSAQRAMADTVKAGFSGAMGVAQEGRDSLETGVAETRDAVRDFARAMSEYATHLASHTAAVQALSSAAQDSAAASQEQRKILQLLASVLNEGNISPRGATSDATGAAKLMAQNPAVTSANAPRSISGPARPAGDNVRLLMHLFPKSKGITGRI